MSNAQQDQASAVQNATDGAESETAAPEYVKATDVAQIVNTAVSSHTKRLEKRFEEKLAKLMAPAAPTDAPDGAPDGKQAPSKTSPEVASLKKQIDELTALYKASNEKAEAIERAQREDNAYGQLLGELNGKVRPEMVGDLADLLFKARKQVYINEDNDLVFKLRMAPAKGMPEEDVELPLADGVREFLKSSKAAPYMPPPNPGGSSGETGRQPAGSRTGVDASKSGDPAERVRARLAKLKISL